MTVSNTDTKHNDETLTFQLNTADDFCDGPWTEVLDIQVVLTGIQTTSMTSTTRFDADAVDFIGRDASQLYRSACIFDINSIPSDATILKARLETYNTATAQGAAPLIGPWVRVGGIWSEASGDATSRVFVDIATGEEFAAYSSQAGMIDFAPAYLNDVGVQSLQNHIGSGLGQWQLGLSLENEAVANRNYQITATVAATPSQDIRLWLDYSRAAAPAPSGVAINSVFFGCNF
jgi:hypothetical protein